MAMIRVSCPHCSFSREVLDSQLPDQPVKAHCPKCKKSFDFFKGAVPPAASFEIERTAA